MHCNRPPERLRRRATTAEQRDSAFARLANDWMARDDSPAALLIGASHLLATPERGAAMLQLRRLTANADRRVAWMAQAQLWRGEAVSADESELRRWLEAIEQMPSPLRAGPYVVSKKRAPSVGPARDSCSGRTLLPRAGRPAICRGIVSALVPKRSDHRTVRFESVGLGARGAFTHDGSPGQ